MLTLAIAGGETPIGAFARIADRSDSYLSKEFAKVVQQVRNGRPFHESLDEMSRSLKSPSIRRFIDALVMALVRGAPIVEVLHRHVAEARINQRNLVMDKAGKAETTMMIPIVFLILPISVLFALWPSINQLSFFAS
jgi:tight adherence protein C